MATKKYLSLERLTDYDALIKAEIDEKVSNKQDKTLIVTKGSDGLASHTPAEILAYTQNGANAVYYDGGTYHSYLDGNSNAAIFYSSYVNESKIQFTIYQVYSNKTIEGTRSSYNPPVTSVNGKTGAIALTAADVDADVAGSADTKVDAHNTNTSAHNDIRVLINDLTTQLNNFLDVDEDTTDQLSEVLTLIDNNKGTLESLTTSKVNVTDIIDNLTTASADKVLSANQGVAIKSLINALQTEVDGKADETHTHAISDVTNLQSTLDEKATKENLNSHTSNSNIHITADERTAWNSKVNVDNPSFTGSVSANRLANSTVGENSIALGVDNEATGRGSVAIGYKNGAYSQGAVAEGWESHADGLVAHAEGYATHAEGWGSHAEGYRSHTEGNYSHAEGEGTTASGNDQHVQGRYNIADTTSAHIVGNGDSENTRSNVHTLDWSGNAWFAGDVYVGSTSGTNKDEGSKKLATVADIEDVIPEVTSNDNGKFLRVVNGASVWTTVPDWVNSETKPTYTYDEVGAAEANHIHDDRYYTKDEIESMLGTGNVFATAVVS